MNARLVTRRAGFFVGFSAVLGLLLPSAGGIASAQEPAVAEQSRVSEFGRYEGYTEPLFDGWQRSSFYIEMSDGVKLACDLFRPTLGGSVTAEPLPLIWTHDRYQRAAERGGSVFTKVSGIPYLQDLLRHGYCFADVDVRGGGASFGNWVAIFGERESDDAYEVIEWFAEQSWCDGNLGMWGGSYLGGTQFMAASRKSPHLKAIFPSVAPCEFYEVIYPGGIYRHDLAETWSDLTKRLDRTPSVPPVDEDPTGKLRAEAQRIHLANVEFAPAVRKMVFRDSPAEPLEFDLFGVCSPANHLADIEESDVPVYHQGGWFDPFTRDAFVMRDNLGNPQKAVMGPWFHGQNSGVDWSAELRRWFDYWLKDIDNGIMDEESIHYYTMGAPEDEAWRATDQWPLPNEQRTRYYFLGGTSGSIDSVNDGLLGAGTPPTDDDLDEYTASAATTTGRITKWSNCVGRGGSQAKYIDLADNDRLCLTYTTPVLTQGIEVTGHPVVHLWVETQAPDCDLFVYLEEIDENGFSQYISEGSLRASHRALGQAPYERLGLPYHRSFEADQMPLEGEPVELVFDLHPFSNLFNEGHRIRVAIAGGDHDNALTPPESLDIDILLLRSPDRASFIDLPVIPSADTSE